MTSQRGRPFAAKITKCPTQPPKSAKNPLNDATQIVISTSVEVSLPPFPSYCLYVLNLTYFVLGVDEVSTISLTVLMSARHCLAYIAG